MPTKSALPAFEAEIPAIKSKLTLAVLDVLAAADAVADERALDDLSAEQIRDLAAALVRVS